MTGVEAAAVALWRRWGDYARFGICSDCGERAYLRAHRPSGPFLCVACFDQTPAAAALARHLAEEPVS